MRKEIANELPEEGYKDDMINIYWTVRKSWKYSPVVKGLETQIKETKKQEEENGIATAEESKSLTFKVK